MEQHTQRSCITKKMPSPFQQVYTLFEQVFNKTSDHRVCIQAVPYLSKDKNEFKKCDQYVVGIILFPHGESEIGGRLALTVSLIIFRSIVLAMHQLS